MKKAINVFLIISLSILLVFSLLACADSSDKNENAIIGTWENLSDSSSSLLYETKVLIFYSDHTLSYIESDNSPMIDGWTWAYDKKAKTYTLCNEKSATLTAIIEDSELKINDNRFAKIRDDVIDKTVNTSLDIIKLFPDNYNLPSSMGYYDNWDRSLDDFGGYCFQLTESNRLVSRIYSNREDKPSYYYDMVPDSIILKENGTGYIVVQSVLTVEKVNLDETFGATYWGTYFQMLSDDNVLSRQIYELNWEYVESTDTFSITFPNPNTKIVRPILNHYDSTEKIYNPDKPASEVGVTGKLNPNNDSVQNACTKDETNTAYFSSMRLKVIKDNIVYCKAANGQYQPTATNVEVVVNDTVFYNYTIGYFPTVEVK